MPTWRAALGIREPLVVLNVKRLHELAGQRFLIDAFARAARRRDDVRLVICGTGPAAARLSRTRTRGHRSRARSRSPVWCQRRGRALRRVADVFVLPSLLEALPTVAVEALAAGTPVVSADHPGGLELHELFGDDVPVVPRQNAKRWPNLLARALLRHGRVPAASARQARPAIRAGRRPRFGPAAGRRRAS